MYHAIGTGQSTAQCISITYVSLDKGHVGAINVVPVPLAQVVKDDDLLTLVEQHAHQVGANKSAASGNEDLVSYG